MTKHCVVCGQPFEAVNPRAMTCSTTCRERRWKAIALLAGTHVRRNGRIVRVRTA